MHFIMEAAGEGNPLLATQTSTLINQSLQIARSFDPLSKCRIPEICFQLVFLHRQNPGEGAAVAAGGSAWGHTEDCSLLFLQRVE